MTPLFLLLVLPTVPIYHLLSTCIDASLLGCEEIRKVQYRRSSGGADLEVMKAKDEKELAAQYLTEADLKAQAAMVSALKLAWPGVKIVGEEDGSAPTATSPPPPLRLDMCTELAAGSLSVPLSDVTIYLDPLDGTREFVEGRLENVQSLVGVAVKGRSVLGSVGIPFPSGEMSDPAAVYGLVGLGAGTIGSRMKRPRDVGLTRPIVLTGDSRNELLGAARSAAVTKGGSVAVAGGAGNKFLAAAEGSCDLTIMHFGTSFWDTCASEAVLRSMGGKMTDLFGAPIVHVEAPDGSVKNKLGVVASGAGNGDLHDQLCTKMRGEPLALGLLSEAVGEGELEKSQAVDIARCLDGRPLTLESLSEKLGREKSKLIRYEALESEAFRGMMSDGCRLRLTWGEDGDGGPTSVFYKRVVMGDLESTRLKAKTAPIKLQRDVDSYRVEANFLGSKVCRNLAEDVGIAVPRAFYTDMRPDDETAIESKFSMLLEDFAPENGWRQSGLLGVEEIKASLMALAKFHAYFMNDKIADELEGAIWQSGTYWQVSHQPEMQFSELAQHYEDQIERFGECFKAQVGIDNIEGIGKRLQSVAKVVARKAHPFDPEAGANEQQREEALKWRTVLHGDPKAANVFLRESQDGFEAALIDFQWAGFGLIGTEVAHHIAAAASPKALEIEDELLEHYLRVLNASDKKVQISREDFQEQYEIGLLDTCRICFGYQWSRANFNGRREYLNRNAYNKNAASAAWLVRRCGKLLDRIEV